MSHTTIYDHKVTNVPLFLTVARGLGHKVSKTNTVHHYGSTVVNDAVASVHLKGWRYPLAVTKDGEIHYDHWGSAPKTIEHLGTLMQEYYTELVRTNIPHEDIQYSNVVTDETNGDRVITLVY
jgi:hypothetical protein